MNTSKTNNDRTGVCAWVSQGSVAYVPQQPWIQNSTAEKNILFGKDFDEARYHDTVKRCELLEDFNVLPGGDQTEIGERVRV